MNQKTTIIITCFLITSALIGGGVLWYQQITSHSTPTPVENTNTNTQTTEPVTSGQVIPPTKTDCTDELDTTCWNTYTNKEYRFSFKFPIVVVQIFPNEVFEGGTKGIPSFRFNQSGHFSVGIYSNTEKLTPEQWLNDQYYDYSGKWPGTFQDFILKNISVTKATLDGECLTEKIIIPDNQKQLFYTFNGEFCQKNSNKNQALFISIVKTFNIY